MSTLDPRRIYIARTLRGITKFTLSQQLGVTVRTINKYEHSGAPSYTAPALAKALEFPNNFFTRADPPLTPPSTKISWRCGRRATRDLQESALAAGTLGIEIDQWVMQRFRLPELDLPTIGAESPQAAAMTVRHVWGLGIHPLPNLVQLCESKGIGVYTLPPRADIAEAFSLWHNAKPYVFLGRGPAPEIVRFNLAHELGHLLMHTNEQTITATQEREANAFATELLMPADSLFDYLGRNPNITTLLTYRNCYQVPALPLAHSLHSIGGLTEYAYRQTCIELSQRGFRTAEPNGMTNYEMSAVFRQILSPTRGATVSARKIAADLCIPTAEVHALTFGAQLRPAQNTEVRAYLQPPSGGVAPHLYRV